jgi:hypothetical protein
MKKTIYFFILFSLLISGAAFGDSYTDDPKEGLKIALQDYQNGEYLQAYKKFKSLAEIYPIDGHYSTSRDQDISWARFFSKGTPYMNLMI